MRLIKKAENLYLVQDSIKGLADYVEGKTSDFGTVGVKAVDDYTLQYTLNQPETYWNSKTTASILSPVNEAFLKSKGDDFGSVTPSSILSNGPYLFKSFTSKSLIEFDKNPNYWDKDNVKIEKVKLSFFDGSDQDSIARGFLMVTIQMAVFSQQVQSLLNSRRVMRTRLPIHRKTQLLSTIFST